MINIIKENNGLVISGKELSRFFNSDGYLNVPLNSIILVTQTKSDIVIFKSASDYVTLFQTRWDNLTIEGELVTKENIIEKFNAIANAPQGSKINAGTNITLQEEADGSITISATGELGGTVAWADVTDKPSTFTPSAHNHVVADITDLQGKLDEKANVSDIPNLDGYATEEWVNSQGYLTEHQDISQLATKSELATKQDTLVSGTNIKTINGQDILGEGNITIEGGTGDVTKQYVDEQLALKVDKTAYEADKATFALKSEIPSIEGLASKEELQNGLDGKQDKGDYALKSELPDISGLATKAEVDETYAKKTEIPDISNLATKEELEAKADASALSTKQDTLVSGTNIKTINGQTVLGEGNIEIQGGGGGIADAPSDGKKYVRQNANWVEETTVDTSNFATKAELDGKVDDAEIADMLTKTEAASTYQPKGDYLTAVPDEYVTETELSEKGYLTEIPSEYVTETELSAKSYATTTQLDSKLDTETYNSDKSTFATKEELADKANTSDLSNYLQTSVAESTYAKKSEIPEEYTLPIATAEALGGIKVGAGLSINPQSGVLSATGGGTADSVDWANITSKPETFKPEAHQHVTADVTDLQDKLDAKADTTDIADMATKTWVNSQGYLTEHQDISTLATKQEVTEGLANKQDKGNYITVETADGKYQVKGDYLTSVPEEYVTETELNGKGYATTTQLEGKLDTSTYTEDKATFALKSEITDMATQTWVTSQGYLTEHQDISTLATKSEVTSGLATKLDTSTYTSEKETFALKSELTDFITASVDNLVNYYKKSETYTKGEVDGKISAITTINFEVVGELPGSGEANKIYLVPNAEQGEQNVKDEYIWVDGKWEIIGSTKVDLSNYYNKGDVDSKLSAKVDLSTYTSDKETFALKSEISDMATQTWVTSQGYLTSHQDISNLATKQEVTEGLAGKQDKGDYALKSELPDISNLATKDELDLKANTSDLSNYLTTANAETTYAKKSEIPSLDGYLQTSTADEKYATKTELEGKVDDADIADMATQTWVTSQGYLTEHQDISQLATKQELTEGLAGKQAVGNYVTVESADAKYQVKGDYLTEIPAEYVTETELSEKGYLTSIPDEYITETELNGKGYKKIIYITQAQYDELPNKEEGVLYVITDAPEVVIPDTSTFATKNELQEALNRISALESQIGILSAQLDSINGEIIN